MAKTELAPREALKRKVNALRLHVDRKIVDDLQAAIDETIKPPTTAEAMSVVINALRSDSGYWQSWQANIAVAFQDEFDLNGQNHSAHKVANDAAARFLKNLTHKPSEA